MIKALIFDLDGTLVDTLKDLCVCTNEVLKEYNYKEIEIEEFKCLVGNGIRKLIERAISFSNGDIKLIDEILDKFLKLYEKNCIVYSTLYENIKTTLDFLIEHKYLMFVNTNKHQDIALKILNKLLPNYFNGIYGVSIEIPKKPDPYIINKIKNDYKLNDDEIIYIGDSEVDILTAHNANIKVVGCSYGFRSRDELIQKGSDYLIDNILELLKIINK